MARTDPGDIGNSQRMKHNITLHSDEFFAAFDALRSKVRLFLDAAPYPTNPIEVLKLIRRGANPDAVIEMLKGAFKKATVIESARAYGPIHPQART